VLARRKRGRRGIELGLYILKNEKWTAYIEGLDILHTQDPTTLHTAHGPQYTNDLIPWTKIAPKICVQWKFLTVNRDLFTTPDFNKWKRNN
jgi:hypothetical protein